MESAEFVHASGGTITRAWRLLVTGPEDGLDVRLRLDGSVEFGPRITDAGHAARVFCEGIESKVTALPVDYLFLLTIQDTRPGQEQFRRDITILPDWTVLLGLAYQPDTATRAFWVAVEQEGRRRQEKASV